MATQTDAVSLVYARSLLELATDAGGREKIEEIGDELQQVCELARSDKGFAEFLSSPIIDVEKRTGVLKRIFADRVTDLTLRSLLVLNRKGRLGHLEAIADAYDRLVQEQFGRVEVDVYTPNTLGEQQLNILAERIRTALGKEPVLHSYAEPDMIGGVKLRIGDQLIDGSVATRLRRLKNGLLTGGSSAMSKRLTNIIDGDVA